MTLQQLKTIYSLQFPVLKTYESDTWYDSNGRIVFTNNRSLTNVGFSRSEWENGIKGAPAGQKFYRTITDDTMPGVAPWSAPLNTLPPSTAATVNRTTKPHGDFLRKSMAIHKMIQQENKDAKKQ